MICFQRGTSDAGNKREDLMFYGFLEPSGINKHNLYLNRLKYLTRHILITFRTIQ